MADPIFLPELKPLTPLSWIKETHKYTICAKWGVESFEAPSGKIFHSSPVLTAGRVKKYSIFVHGLYTYQGSYFCVSSLGWYVEPRKAEDEVLVHYTNPMLHYSPVGKSWATLSSTL